MTDSPMLHERRALVVGGGQTPGTTIGNGRATAIRFAQEGAVVAVADRELDRAQETAAEIEREGGQAFALQVDVTDEASVIAMVEAAVAHMGGIDVLHNNVGVSLAGGDGVVTEIDLDAFDRVTRINLTGMVATCKHVIPVMQRQRGGAIVSIGSLASIIDYPTIAYKTSKAGVVQLTQNVAIRHAKDGIRANAILPGLMQTPMAIENRVGRDGQSRDDVVAMRDARVPLHGRQGSGWDVAEAAVFLASDRAQFITGVALPVDGGQSLVQG